jgi:hypothetical protein
MYADDLVLFLSPMQ